MNRKLIQTKVAALALCVLLLACGGGFFTQLRIILSASGPLVESLPLSSSVKAGLVTDFTDMAGKSADFADCLKAAPTKPEKLTCTQTLQSGVEAIIGRGHFGQANNPKLNTVLGILRGIISSAKIFYGERRPSVRGGVVPTVTEESIKVQIRELKEAMRP